MITKADRKRYALHGNIKIFLKVKKLEKKKLRKEDKEMLKFIKSQLAYDWRRPLIKKLKDIGKRCR